MEQCRLRLCPILPHTEQIMGQQGTATPTATCINHLDHRRSIPRPALAPLATQSLRTRCATPSTTLTAAAVIPLPPVGDRAAAWAQRGTETLLRRTRPRRFGTRCRAVGPPESLESSVGVEDNSKGLGLSRVQDPPSWCLYPQVAAPEATAAPTCTPHPHPHRTRTPTAPSNRPDHLLTRDSSPTASWHHLRPSSTIGTMVDRGSPFSTRTMPSGCVRSSSSKRSWTGYTRQRPHHLSATPQSCSNTNSSSSNNCNSSMARIVLGAWRRHSTNRSKLRSRSKRFVCRTRRWSVARAKMGVWVFNR